jgi:hypothetical protein
MAFLPAGALVAASSTKMSLVLARVRTPVLIAVGLSSLLAGYLLFLRVGTSDNYANFLLPTILLLGLGFALTFPAVNVQATAGVADHEQGLASGLLNTAIQVGGAVVLAVVTAILTASGKGTTLEKGDLLPGTMPALAVIVGVSVAGLLYTLVRIRADRPVPAEQVEYALAD